MWFPFTTSRSVSCDIGCYPGHNGKDYGCSDGTNVYSPISGKVTRVENSISGQLCDEPNFGNYIEITSSTIKVKMAHLKKGSIPWEVNDDVSAGDLAGKASNTGYTFTYDSDLRDFVCGEGGGYHLHLETRYKVNGVWVVVDPTTYSGGLWTSPLTYPSGSSNPPPPSPPSVTYGAGWSTQSPFVIEMEPDQTATFTVKYINLGSSTWKSNGYTTSDPNYVELRACDENGTVQNGWLYSSNNWITAQRVGKANEATIPANDDANFSFTVKVPSNKPPGTYRQYFRLYHSTAGYMSTPRGNYDGYYVEVHVLSTPPAPQTAFGIILRNPATAQWWARPSNESAFVYPVGANWPPDLWLDGWAQDGGGYTFTPYVGDLDGDSYDDLVVERSDCNWYVAWNNQDGSFTEQGSPILSPWGTSPSPGKYFFWFVNVKGDAKNELLTYDASNGSWYVSSFNTSNQTYDSYSTWITWGSGIGTYQPLVGDWDGDGDTDICLRNPSTGNHYVRLSNGSNAFVQGTNDNWIGSWGASSAFTPLVGDWSGDGKDDICLFNASNGDHYVRLSNGSSFYQGTNDNWLSGWAGSGYIPFVGDFDDDGKSDLGLRNPELGDHWVRLSTGSAFSQPSPDNWQAGWGAAVDVFQLLTGRFGNGTTGGGFSMRQAPPDDDRTSESPPISFRLWSVPSPMKSEGAIFFTLPVPDRVRISIYDISGREIGAIPEIEYGVGQHSVRWLNPEDGGERTPMGIYLIRLTSNLYTATRKVVVIN